VKAAGVTMHKTIVKILPVNGEQCLRKDRRNILALKAVAILIVTLRGKGKIHRKFVVPVVNLSLHPQQNREREGRRTRLFRLEWLVLLPELTSQEENQRDQTFRLVSQVLPPEEAGG
jgi:hypothetical protein